MVTRKNSTSRRRIAAGIAAIAVVTVGAITVAPTASAATVLIDDFAGSVLGTRTVQTLPAPNTSTTAAGTFSESGGIGTIVAGGDGNSAAGVRLTYNMSAKDLTSGGANDQFFLEFTDIARGPQPELYSTAANISIAVTSANGVTGTYSTGVNSTNGPFNIVLNMNCNVNPVCFNPQPNFTQVTKVEVSIMFPTNHHSASTLTAKLEQIRTTPPGGAVPLPPSVSIGAPSGNPIYVASGASLTFPVTVIPGTSTTTLDNPLTLSDLQSSGSAGGTVTALSMMGNSGTVTISGLTSSGTVQLSAQGGAVRDSWDQPSAASSSPTVNVVVVPPPSLTGADLGTTYRTQPYSHTFNGGLANATTYSVTAGSPPSGLSLSSSGVLNGTPTTNGTYNFTIKATNVAGSSSAQYSLTVANAVEFTSPTTASFTVGQAGSFDVTTSGTVVDPLTYTGTLPAGLTFTAGANGTATIAGTATSPGESTIIVKAGTDASQTLTIKRNKIPSFTPSLPAAWAFAVGSASSFTVTTSAYPTASVMLTGTLPAGVTWTDNGDGTATLAGTPAAGTGATYPVTITSTNSLGSATAQSVNLVVSQPAALTAPASATMTKGVAGSVSVSATGYPTPTFSASGLPAGLTLTDLGDGTATISGIPTNSGDSTVSLTASNASGNASKSIALRVQDGPAISSSGAATWTRGSAGSFTITTTGYPKPAITTASALPTGLTLTDNGNGTATLAGTPTVHGVFTVQLSAANGVGTAATQSLTVTIAGAPVITAHANDTAVVGSAYSTTVVATGYPVPALTVTGLPAGLSATDDGHGVLTLAGTPAANSGGQYTITVTAVNATASVNSTYTLTVNQAAAWTSGADTTLTQGVQASVTLTAAGYPQPTAAIVGGSLPPGLTVSYPTPGSVAITGTPTQAGVFTVNLSATNGVGSAAPKTIVLTVHDTPALTGDVTIAGSGLAGQPLTATSTLSSTVAVTYVGQWLRDGFVIPGATDATYTPTNADAGSALSYRVTASAPTYNNAVVTSNALTSTGVITLADPVVTGSAVVDGLLTATVPSVDPSTATVTYVWSRGATTVGTDSTYTPVPADQGETLTVTAKATLADFQTTTKTATTPAVAEAVFSVAPAVAITGTAQVGQELAAVFAPSTPAADAYSYQWLVDGVAVSGATHDTYQILAADKGHVIAAQVTAQRDGYVSARTTSAATVKVVTDKAPNIDFKVARESLRRGQSTSVTWSTVDATRVVASGSWSGTLPAQGTLTIRPTGLGTAVYVITATNHIGTTTAQVAVVVDREAKRIPVTVSKKSLTAGSKATVTASGLDKREAFTVTVAGKQVAKGTANARGIARVKVKFPSLTTKQKTVKVVVTGASADRTGKTTVKVKPKTPAKPKSLSVKAISKVRASDKQTIKVTGLRSRERVTVYVEGVRISPSKAHANAKGNYQVTYKVGTSWGTRSVKVVGAKSHRIGRATFTVLQRCANGVWVCR